jgi:hypothetical protein
VIKVQKVQLVIKVQSVTKVLLVKKALSEIKVRSATKVLTVMLEPHQAFKLEQPPLVRRVHQRLLIIQEIRMLLFLISRFLPEQPERKA